MRTPAVWWCGVQLVVVRAALRFLGYATTVRAIHRIASHVDADVGDAPHVSEIARRVATAAAFFPGRALCLEQSVALYYNLRRLGIPARLRLGVQPRPFAAHAWVEFRGQPVNERDQLKQFLPLPDVRL
jgi:transglutaminase-like putative cysteine protease